MLRLEVVPGEVPLPVVGAMRGVDGLFGARRYPGSADSRHTAFEAAEPPHERPCCKTCNGGGCVGHCKF